jgi:hypothetical protein
MDGGAPLSTSATRGSALNGLSPVTTHLDSDQDSPLASSALFGDSALAPHFHQHHSNFLRDRDEDAHEIQPDVVIESIFNPTAANEYTPFTFLASEDHGVENDGDADDTENDDGFEPGITRAQLIHARHGVAHPNAWDKLRRRVINSHHLKTQT